MTVTGGTMTTSGSRSPGIRSTGDIAVTRATLAATGSEGAAIDIDGPVYLKDVAMTGSSNALYVHNTVGQPATAVGVATGDRDGVKVATRVSTPGDGGRYGLFSPAP